MLFFIPQLYITSSDSTSSTKYTSNKKPRRKEKITSLFFSSTYIYTTTALPKQAIVLAEVNNSRENRTHFFSSFTVFRAMADFKRNQIPAFGNWDFSDGLPITQYFESARQAGLVRYSCGERDLYGAVADDFLYSNPPHSYQHDLIKPPSITVVSRRKTKGGVPREKRYSNNNNSIKEQKKHGRVYDVTEPAKHHHQQHQHQHHSSYSHDDDEVEQYHHHQRYISHPQRISKAVDEDLYKIPPELLYKPKRNKMLGFFSCLVPTCAA